MLIVHSTAYILLSNEMKSMFDKVDSSLNRSEEVDKLKNPLHHHHHVDNAMDSVLPKQEKMG